MNYWLKIFLVFCFALIAGILLGILGIALMFAILYGMSEKQKDLKTLNYSR